MVSSDVTDFQQKTCIKISPELQNGTELHLLLEILFDLRMIYINKSPTV